MLALRHLLPRILCVLIDSPRVEREWDSLLDVLDAVSPLIDDVRPGLLYLDMRGIPGDAPDWIAQARACLTAHGVASCIGAGANKFTAYAAARRGDGTICGVGLEGAFLAPLPLELLDVGERVRERLRLLGVERLGDLARLPHGAFVRRFGPQAARWHACARGEDSTPFRPRAHAVAVEAAMFGEGRVEEEAQLFFALRVVLARVCADLERCGKRAGSLDLMLELEDGTARHIDVMVASPTTDEKTLGEIVRAKLSGNTFSSPVVGLRLRAGQMEEGGEAMPIFPADDIDPRRVAVTIARLEAVTDEKPRRARIHPAHALERRFSYEAFSCHPIPVEGNASLSSRAGRGERPFVIPSERGARAASDIEGSASQHLLVSQLRLLTVREIPVRLHRGAPASVNGRRVIECNGPWRIEEGWFEETAVTRDEYDVLLEDRSLLRIYRQGKHWYLRGAYD